MEAAKDGRTRCEENKKKTRKVAPVKSMKNQNMKVKMFCLYFFFLVRAAALLSVLRPYPPLPPVLLRSSSLFRRHILLSIYLQ